MGGGHHHHLNKEAMPRDDQDLDAIKAAGIPIAFRDTCSHLLIKLNKCRHVTWSNPTKCTHERHTYEECEYYAFLQRVEAKKQLNRIRDTAKATAGKEEDL
jgi:NADH-ubiquinone oxidoreductase B18 subunit (NDUFB7)